MSITHEPTQEPQPIIVGVDGHEPSRVALDWAIDEASRRGLPLELVNARPIYPRDPTAAYAGPEVNDAHSLELLRAAADRAQALAPGVAVATRAERGAAADVLVDSSPRAALVVVGARGHGAVRSAFLGSTSIQVAAHARCPVAVVRALPQARPERPGVVVGVDGSDVSKEAVGVAFAEADERQLPLTVVHSWFMPYEGRSVVAFDSEELRRQIAEEEHVVAAESIAGWSEKYPDVRVRQHVLHDHPVAALVDHSLGAELLVVGCRGRGGFGGMMLGSVSQGVLHHAQCPVIVVHASTDELAADDD
ncbi:universal stress protein [Pedococcus sp.]|jgi:nucleotide-binding universal stress UspA family protein|uniref:universal stress protein n=1 Tax=Pedococcus sp. TaxID=2860345 RepID=UPI002E12DB8D|nr:universal stress protein [Pedococcus sp.]